MEFYCRCHAGNFKGSPYPDSGYQRIASKILGKSYIDRRYFVSYNSSDTYWINIPTESIPQIIGQSFLSWKNIARKNDQWCQMFDSHEVHSSIQIYRTNDPEVGGDSIAYSSWRFEELSNEKKKIKLLSVLNFDEKLMMHSISDPFTTYEILGKSRAEHTGYVLFPGHPYSESVTWIADVAYSIQLIPWKSCVDLFNIGLRYG